MKYDTKKHIFITDFKYALENGKTKYVAGIMLPGGVTEIIINTENLENKLEYIDNTYDDDLALKMCKDIKIVSYMFC